MSLFASRFVVLVLLLFVIIYLYLQKYTICTYSKDLAA